MSEAEERRAAPRRRRLMVLTPTLGVGGAERVVLTIVRNLDRSRFDLSLVILDGSQLELLDDVPADVEVVVLHARRLRYGVAKVLAALWRIRPDIVFSAFVDLSMVLSLVRPFWPRRFRLLGRETTTISAALKKRGKPWLWRGLLWSVTPLMDAVVFQSGFTEADFRETIRPPHLRSVIIPNPVDIGFIRSRALAEAPASGFAADALELVAAGRLQPVKGYDLLLDALAQVQDRRLCLTLVGDGPERANLERQAEALGLAGRVRFAGMQANPYPFFRRAAAFVLSSRYEGFPNVVLEALACGAPVIATPLGGVKEVLHDLAGCQVAEAVSAEAIADRLRCFAAQPPGRMAPDAVESFDAGVVVRRYEELLLRLN